MDILEQYKTPGQYLQHLLDERQLTQKVLAFIVGIDESSLAKIIAGKRQLDANLALKLGAAFEVPAEHFTQLQTHYDLALARLTSTLDPRLAARTKLYQSLPLSEMVKRGWLRGVENLRNQTQVESALCEFFGKSSMEDLEAMPHAAKRSQVSPSATPVQTAWLHRVQQLAVDVVVAPYSESSLRTVIENLGTLLGDPIHIRKVPDLLSEAGVRFVVVEALQSAKIDGATFWLSDDAPVVGLSLRFDRIDNFWFVLRHELEHVLRGHGKDEAVIDDLSVERGVAERVISEEEQLANQAAATFCVDQAALSRFIDKKSPSYQTRDVVGFARTLKVHPGLVAGQLQKRTSRYELFRNFLVPIRTIITAVARTDGWGEIAHFASEGGSHVS